MRELLNDFISLVFGKKEYSTLELLFAYGFIVFIIAILLIVKIKI